MVVLYVYTQELQKLMMGWVVGMIIFAIAGILLIRFGSIDAQMSELNKLNDSNNNAGVGKKVAGFICIGIAVCIFFYAMIMCNIKG